MRLVLSSTCDLNVSKFQRYREQNEKSQKIINIIAGVKLLTTRVTLTLSIITAVNGTSLFSER